MSDTEGRNDGSSGRPPASEDAALAARLRELDRGIDRNRSARGGSASRHEAPDRPGMALALKLGADFVAGVLVGAALGWGFDRLFGTSPWGLTVFLLLGFAAGVLSVMRSAGLAKPRNGGSGGDDTSA
jgi:ATP synthase protein I